MNQLTVTANRGDISQTTLYGCMVSFTLNQCKTLNVTLSSCFVAYSQFISCDLTGIDFSYSDLTGSKFINCCLKEANFAKSILADVNFNGSNLLKANLLGTNLDGIVFNEHTVFKDTCLDSRILPKLSSLFLPFEIVNDYCVAFTDENGSGVCISKLFSTDPTSINHPGIRVYTKEQYRVLSKHLALVPCLVDIQDLFQCGEIGWRARKVTI